jgi:hypothetical protein
MDRQRERRQGHSIYQCNFVLHLLT